MRWRTLCALVGLASIAAPVEPAPIEPLGGYLSPNGAPSGGQTLFSPWHVWADEAGAVVQNITAESQEECAALCWQDPDCTLFDFRSCADEDTSGSCAGAPSHTCRMFAMGCQVVPLGLAVEPNSGGTHWASAGFPVRDELQDAGTFGAHPGSGLSGGELVCNASLVPGKCAVASLIEAAILCGTWPECDVVVYYSAGLDGCSSPLFLLLSSRLAGSGFLAPTVSTLNKLDNAARFRNMLLTSDGNYSMPTAEELAAAAAANASSDARPYLGCFSGAGLLMAGTSVGVLDGIPDAGACCRTCREKETCNVWTFCAEPAGCNYTHDSRTFQLAGGQCELRFNDVSTPIIGFPPAVLSKGEDVPFFGGAPLNITAPQPLPSGFAALPGVTLNAGGRLPCAGSLRPEIGECVLAGSTQELASACQSTPNCSAVVSLQHGWMGLAGGQPVGILKSNVSQSQWALGVNSVLLLRQDEGQPSSGSSSSGLSAGAIAGIAVGACAAVAAAAAAAWLLVQRRRKARPVGQVDGKAEIETALAVAVEPSLPLHDSSYSVAQHGNLPTERSAAVAAAAASSHSTLTGSSVATAGQAAALPLSQGSNVSALPHSWDAAGPIAEPATAGAAAAAGVAATAAAAPGMPVSTPTPQGFAVSKHLSLSGKARPSPFAAMSAAWSQASAPPFLMGRQPGELSNASREASSGPMLPELKQHIAHCDAAISYGRHMAPAGSMDQRLIKQPSLLSRGELPAALQEWVVDIRDIEFLKNASGAPLELGAGASGTVYKAKLRGETVAAKEMDLGRSPEVQELFVREAERLHQLRHPHVVALYGVALSGPQGILLMEYCAGRDLTSCLQLRAAGSSRRLFGWYSKGRRIAVDIAAALGFLHSRGIVHFDIKSSNVLLTGTGAAKLADVGVARLQHGTHLSYTPVVGTFAWMAPEIIIGARCTEKVDLFSMGVLLWEICTGERPQRGSMRPPQVPQECPQEVADLISQCMSLDPSERPSAQQLLSRLEELAAMRGPPSAGGSSRTISPRLSEQAAA